ncbi:unnamed protein product [Clonostachys solani]|uniref:F-box domain-containing protein n=1 Tax=Clonostachys solani TaxID=160281 RepID=A0A9N9Z8K6_9HYPO|nr:unnamed protein product [Clonostachys solani]
MSQVGDTRLGEVCQPLQPAASTLSRSASLPGSTAPGQRDRPPEGSPPACPDVPQPGYPSNTGQAEASQPKWNEIYSLNPSVDQAEIERWGHKAFHEGSYYYQPLHDLWCKLSTYVSNFISATGPIKCMWHLLDDKTKGRLISFCPISPKIIEDGKKGCSHLMLAWVWRILYDNLLSPDCTDKWSSEEWAHLGSFQQSLQKGGLPDESNAFTHAYHAAKFWSVRMAYMRFGPHSSAERLEKVILDEILPVMKLRNHPENQVELSDSESGSEPDIDPKTGLHSELDKLLSRVARTAVELDLWILASGKNVRVDFRDPETGNVSGFPYKPDYMIPENNLIRTSAQPAVGAPVDLVVEPLLRSFGERATISCKQPGFVDFYRSAFGNHHKRTGTSKMWVVVDHFDEYKGGEESTALGGGFSGAKAAFLDSMSCADWECFCAVCGGPLRNVSYFIDDDEGSPRPGMDAYDPNVFLTRPEYPELEWLDDIRALGENPKTGASSSVWLSGPASVGVDGNVRFDLDKDSDPALLDLPGAGDMQAYCLEGRDPWCAPFHVKCHEVLRRFLGVESLDKEVLNQIFKSLGSRDEWATCLGIDYGDIAGHRTRDWFPLRNHEYLVSDPIDIEWLARFYKKFPLRKEGDGEPGGDYNTQGDPFSTLPPDILSLLVLSIPTMDGVFKARMASPAIANVPLSQSFWKSRIVPDMPWLWDMPTPSDEQRSSVDWSRVYKELFWGSQRNKTLGLCNRRRIWTQMCPQFGTRYASITEAKNQ